MNPPDTRLVRTFLAVAEELNFTRAARRLHLTQQAVSAQVQALEEAVGVQLLERTTRSVALTPAGKALRDGAVAGFSALDGAVEQARVVGQGLRGVVRAGHTTGAGWRLVPATVAALRRTAPGLELDSIQCTPAELFDAIRSGRLDLGIGLEIQDCGAGLRSRVAWTEPWMVGIPPTDPLAAGGGPVRLADLADRRWINWPRDTHPGYWDALHTLCAAAGFTPRVETARIGLADFLAAAGTGAIHLLPASCLAHPLPGRLILPLEPSVPPARYAAIWPTDRPTPALEQILTALTTVPPPP